MRIGIYMGSYIEYRNCPCCGHDDFEVVFESNMKAEDFTETVGSVYMIPGTKWGRHVRCRDCHLTYVNPIEKASKIDEDYSNLNSNDSSIIRSSRLRAAKSQVKLIDKYADGANLLDIGCGEGFFLFTASRAGFAARGVELSHSAAEYARREFNLDVKAAHLAELRFPDDCFDVVTLWQVLEHVPYPLELLREVHRILRPGGLLVVATPNFGGVLSKVFGKRWWEIRRIHITQFNRETLIRMLQTAEFRDLSGVTYRECVSLHMIVTQVSKYLRSYQRFKALRNPGSVLGRIADRIQIAYPSTLNCSTVIGFKS